MDGERYNIDVQVEPTYLDEESDPEEGRYVFAYTVVITNRGSVGAQLLHRHWIVTGADGETREVQGEGVVGEQPRLDPGKVFRYTSGALLETPVGTMEGHYEMLAEDGVSFTAEIPVFTLAVPRTLH